MTFGWSGEHMIGVGDFNGDGIGDPIFNEDANSPSSWIWYSDYPDGTPGLLKSVTDELGGTVSLKYTPSSRFDHDFMPFVMPLVTSLSHDDGRGQVAETNYAYEGGKYDVTERRFLGFAKVTETKPLANGETARPSVETMLRQDVASYGLPESVTYKDGSGTVRKVVTHSYAVNAATKPYTALRTASETALTQNEVGTVPGSQYQHPTNVGDVAVYYQGLIDGHLAQIATIEGQISTTEGQISSLNTQIATTQSDITTLEGEIANTEALIAQYEQERASNQASANFFWWWPSLAASYQAAADAAEANRIAQEAILATQQTDLANLQTALSNQQTQLSNAQTSLTGLQTDLANEQAALADDQARLADYQLQSPLGGGWGVAGNPLTLTTRIERFHDGYGNVIEERHLGRTDVAGDETTRVSTYVANTTDHIVSLPSVMSVHAGSGTSGALLSQEQLSYDGGAHGVAPTKGHVTARTVLRSSDGSLPAIAMSYGYDAHGNRTHEVDGEGNRTEWDYDTTYNLYPVTERNALYFGGDTRHQVTRTYNAVCGVAATLTDLNGVQHTYGQDVFCRHYNHVNTVTGAEERIVYMDEGNAAAQRFLKAKRRPNGANNWTNRYSYFDGRGRVYVEIECVPDCHTDSFRVSTVHDERNNVKSVSHPYVFGATQYKTLNTYDWADRVVSTTNPDGSSRTMDYLVANTIPAGNDAGNVPLTAVRLSDELGRTSVAVTGTRGKVIYSHKETANSKEWHSYDAFDRLTGVKDNIGATWSYSYDLAGNRLSVSDPDLGNWSYAYDQKGRLTSQSDARGSVTAMTYDGLDRPLTRTITAPVVADPVLAQFTYDEARSGYYNVGQLTSASNSSAARTIDYHASGNEAKNEVTIDGATHTTTTGEDLGELPVWKLYDPHLVTVGSAASP
ncbi:toxin TcdB middle/N-terminal domain-containing protein, partial [Hoeflea poritis]